MKRTLIALGVIAAAAAPLAANANPKIYGKMNLAIEKIDAETNAGVSIEDNWRVSSYASRFGVRGESELTATMSAVYGIEWQVNADGDGTDLAQRNRFAGLKHQDFGTLKLGRVDTYLKLAQGKIDQFNDTKADISDANHGAAAIFAGETRSANVIDYQSPKIADAITIGVQMIPGEDTGATAKYDGLADGISTSVVYDKDALFLALAYDKEVAGNNALLGTPAGNSGRRDTLRAAASFKVADLTLGALYQVSELSESIGVTPTTATEETAALVSAAYKIDDVTLKLQYAMAENDAPTAVERTRLALGADYAFTSKTKVYGYYTSYEQDRGNESGLFAVGLETNF